MSEYVNEKRYNYNYSIEMFPFGTVRVWDCNDCGSMVRDLQAHDKFHNNLDRVTHLARMNQVIG